MRIALFKNSRETFVQALEDASIVYEELKAPPGQIMASSIIINVAQTAAVAGPIAAVLVAWLKARASRKIILTLQDNKIVHLECYSIEQVKELLPLINHGTAIDTQPPANGAK